MPADHEIISLFDMYGRCDAPIGNYYGTPTLIRFDGQWLIVLEDYNSCRCVRVSDSFAEAWINEFDSQAVAVAVAPSGLLSGPSSPWADRDLDDLTDPSDRDTVRDLLAKLATALGIA